MRVTNYFNPWNALKIAYWCSLMSRRQKVKSTNQKASPWIFENESSFGFRNVKVILHLIRTVSMACFVVLFEFFWWIEKGILCSWLKYNCCVISSFTVFSFYSLKNNFFFLCCCFLFLLNSKRKGKRIKTLVGSLQYVSVLCVCFYAFSDKVDPWRWHHLSPFITNPFPLSYFFHLLFFVKSSRDLNLHFSGFFRLHNSHLDIFFFV